MSFDDEISSFIRSREEEKQKNKPFYGLDKHIADFYNETQEKPICGVYIIINPKNKIYVGQSIDCYRRFKNYINNPSPSQTLIYRSLKKYGVENHKFEILHTCDKESLDEAETLFIKALRANKIGFGLNIRKGGKSGGLSEEGRQRLIQINTGKTQRPEDIQKRADKLRGQKRTEKQKENLRKRRNVNKGRKHTNESRENMSKSHLGKIPSEITRERMSESHKGKKRSDTPIILNCLTGVFYEGLEEALRSYGWKKSLTFNGFRTKFNRRKTPFVKV